MPMMFSTQIVKTPSKNFYQRWFPKVGVSVDWAGLTCCLQLKPEGLSIGLDESPKSKLERLKFLPRSSFSFQMSKFNLNAKLAPTSETLSNLKGKELKWPNFMEVFQQQLEEVKTSEEVWDKLNKTKIAKSAKPELTA